jgi:2-dehydro-3-deoxygluconokinase
VDTVGAGDGFAAGVISGVLEGLPLAQAVQRGSAIGTIQIMHVSDNEGLPSREELKRFMNTHLQGGEHA